VLSEGDGGSLEDAFEEVARERRIAACRLSGGEQGARESRHNRHPVRGTGQTPTLAFDPTIDRPLSGFQANLVCAAATFLQNQGRSLAYWQQIETTQEATTEFKRYEDNVRRKNPEAKQKKK
jgi:hypothetical protein